LRVLPSPSRTSPITLDDVTCNAGQWIIFTGIGAVDGDKEITRQ
jgi:hypothetical protein